MSPLAKISIFVGLASVIAVTYYAARKLPKVTPEEKANRKILFEKK